jgi:ribosomal protein L37AE/L43A
MNEQLKLLQTESEPAATVKEEKSPSWQQQFAGYFFYSHKERTGKESKLKFGALKKMLSQHAQKMWVDDETGAPEIPSFEEWKEEVDAYWSDRFAAEEVGFHFSYLLKRYGSFKKFKPVKREASDPVLIWTCRKCSHVMKHPRSKWMVYKDKIGQCSKCRTTFSVNNVLQKIQNVSELLTTEIVQKIV